VNLKEWAQAQGIHPQTAYKMFREGTLPVPAQRVGTRLILVNPEGVNATPAEGVGLYARAAHTTRRAIWRGKRPGSLRGLRRRAIGLSAVKLRWVRG
jgi:hypothetical protein